jgi:hypothetical protein
VRILRTGPPNTSSSPVSTRATASSTRVTTRATNACTSAVAACNAPVEFACRATSFKLPPMLVNTRRLSNNSDCNAISSSAAAPPPPAPAPTRTGESNRAARTPNSPSHAPGPQ